MTLKYGKKKGSKFQLINGNERNGSWRNEKKWRFDPIVGTQKPQVYIMRDRINMLNTLFSRSFFFLQFPKRATNVDPLAYLYIHGNIIFSRCIVPLTVAPILFYLRLDLRQRWIVWLASLKKHNTSLFYNYFLFFFFTVTVMKDYWWCIHKTHCEIVYKMKYFFMYNIFSHTYIRVF